MPSWSWPDRTEPRDVTRSVRWKRAPRGPPLRSSATVSPTPAVRIGFAEAAEREIAADAGASLHEPS
jgi:hypothetical protein